MCLFLDLLLETWGPFKPSRDDGKGGSDKPPWDQERLFDSTFNINREEGILPSLFKKGRTPHFPTYAEHTTGVYIVWKNFGTKRGISLKRLPSDTL